MDSEFGPPCGKCGHPASFWDGRACRFKPGNSYFSCSCRVYEPMENQSLDTELLMLNRNALMDVRKVVRKLECTSLSVDQRIYMGQLARVLRQVGLEE